MFLKISQILQEKHLRWNLFLIKLKRAKREKILAAQYDAYFGQFQFYFRQLQYNFLPHFGESVLGTISILLNFLLIE